MHYYEDWRGAAWTCKECHWQGVGELLIQGEVFSDLCEMNCPRCHYLVAVISFPTYSEAQATWDRVPAADKALLELVENSNQTFNRLKLKTPNQLPDLEVDAVELEWDLIEAETAQTIILYQGKEIWREPAVFEGIERFKEILEILILKYGHRLKDLCPTKISEPDLYGDKIWGQNNIKSIRANLNGSDASKES